MKRNAQLVEGAGQFRVYFLLLPVRLLGRGEVDYVLEVYFGYIEMRPGRLLHRLPLAESVETKVEQPLRFLLAGGNQAHGLLCQSLGDEVLLELGHKTVLVLPGGYFI